MSSKANTKCVTITWKIENFSTYLSPNIELCLRSPVWKTKTTEGSASWWRILVSCSNSNSIGFFLTNLKGDNYGNLYEMSLITSGGESPITSTTSSYPSYPSSGSIENSLILGKNRKSFLPKDTLTFCCRIRQQTIKPGKCLLRTVLHQVHFLLPFSGVSFDSNIQKRTLHQHEMLLLSAVLSKSKEDEYHKVRVEFLPNTGICSAFLSCQLGIKKDKGHVSSHFKDYPGASWSWDIEIYQDCISLRLEIECLVASDMEYQQLTAHPSDTLTDDLLLLYNEKMYSDATLNTEGKSFPVHRGILAARSPVFRAMFEKNKMSEGRSGVVDIEDVDSATVDRMLVFLYGNLLKDLQWEEASALYYAADKYAVLPLKKKCGGILKSGLAADNACDLLVLADRHADQELMKSTVDFMLGHEEVLSSPKWKSLEESNPRLIIKTMRELYSKKGNK